MHNTDRKRRKHIPVVKLLVFIVFVLYAATILFPLVWGLLCSMLTRAQFNAAGSPFKLPGSLNFRNYAAAWRELSANGISMVTMTVNSVWFAVGKSALTVLFSSMTAYVVAKYRFPGRRFIYAFAVGTMMIPIMSNMAASLRFYRALHATDSPLYALLSASGLGFYFILMNATFKSLSWQYAEAAFIDGAGHFRTFFTVMLPQVVSPLTALFMCEFIGRWNDSMAPLVYLPNMPTLASGLYVYQIVTSRAINYPVLFAALMMCLVPVLVLYFIFQESLMDLQLSGGIKG